MLLALETANDHCSVALIDANGIQAFRLNTQSREQTRQLLPMIEQVMQEKNITFSALAAIAFSSGPGSFSGIRINAAVTQALAWAHDIPVIAVSSLQATAQRAYALTQLTPLTVVLDARMNELYSARYQLNAMGLMQATTAEQLLPYQSIDCKAGDVLVGSGCSVATQTANMADVGYYPDIAATAEDIAKIAWHMLQQGKTLTAAQALPVYLRDNAWKKLDAQRALKSDG